MRGLSVLPLRRKALSAVVELGRARGGEMCPTSSSREEGAVHGVGEGDGVDANDEEGTSVGSRLSAAEDRRGI